MVVEFTVTGQNRTQLSENADKILQAFGAIRWTYTEFLAYPKIEVYQDEIPVWWEARVSAQINE
jgi:hypothetical protein